MEPGPYHAAVYWPHVVFGSASIALALAAIFAAKGGRLHRRTGQGFALFMGIAAVTAIAFSFVRPAPAALFSAFSVLYGIGMGILSLRARTGGWKALQWALVVLPLLLGLAVLTMIPGMFVEGAPFIPLPIKVVLIAAIVTVAVFQFWLLVADVKFLRAPDPDRLRRFRRHALRMALAAAETVRAPLISFGPPLGADGLLSFPVYFFGPFLLIPIIYTLAMPAWVKAGEEARAAKLSTAVA